MTTTTLPPRSTSSRPKPIACRIGDEEFSSFGPLVIRWMESMLVHGPGPVLGQPFRLAAFQKSFVLRLYRADDQGRRVVRRALLGLAKGNAKTELAAAIGLAELAGPLAPVAPDVPVCAASFAQAGLLFATASLMVSEGPLAPFVETLRTDLVLREGTGRLYRVAAVGGTNDGSRPTTALFDEVHELVENKERAHLVIGNSLNKRPDGLEINISTAGWDRTSLLGKLYDYGEKVRTGEVEDPSFLYVWHSADPALDLDDPVQLETAIRQANPGVDLFFPLENLVRRFKDPTVPRFEFLRYHLNCWVESEEQWLPPGAWAALASDRQVPDSAEVVLGFDGSRTGDTTALVAATVEPRPHVFVVRLWERPSRAGEDWSVPGGEVMQSIRDACRRWSVREVAADTFLWATELEQLAREHVPVVEFPQRGERMPQATATFAAAVAERSFSHADDPVLARHVAACVVKTDGYGYLRLAKADKSGRRKIDAAVAAVMALERASYYSKRGAAQVLSLADY